MGSLVVVLPSRLHIFARNNLPPPSARCTVPPPSPLGVRWLTTDLCACLGLIETVRIVCVHLLPSSPNPTVSSNRFSPPPSSSRRSPSSTTRSGRSDTRISNSDSSILRQQDQQEQEGQLPTPQTTREVTFGVQAASTVNMMSLGHCQPHRTRHPPAQGSRVVPSLPSPLGEPTRRSTTARQ